MSEEAQRINGLERRVEKIESTLDVLHEIRERLVRLESRIENNLAGCSTVCTNQNSRITNLENKVLALELLVAKIQGAGWAGKLFFTLGGGTLGGLLTWILKGQ